MIRTVNDQPTLWDSLLPAEALVMSAELTDVDRLLDDAMFFAPFVPHFDPEFGRPSIPMETHLRLMFLKFRYRLGYETLCREVTDSISWQRFARIPLGTRVSHPTTLMKITTKCGDTTVAALNEALLVKAAAKLLKTNRVRPDTTVVEGPPTANLLPALDPTAMGWKYRDWYLSIDPASIFDRAGNIGPTVWWNGRIVGAWAVSSSGEIRTACLADRGGEASASIATAAAHLQGRLDGAVPKSAIRTPLEQSLTA